MIYDTTNRIAKFLQYAYDSTGTTLVDSIVVVFSFTSNSNLPYSYSYTHIGQGFLNNIHTLTYDVNNRIIKDTSISGTGFVTYFSYPNNNIASTLLFNGNFDDNQIDTLFISNGNVTSNRVYYSNFSNTDLLSGFLNFGYSSYANPASIPAIANAVGPLLYILTYDEFGGYTDYNSKKLVNQISGIDGGLPLVL